MKKLFCAFIFGMMVLSGAVPVWSFCCEMTVEPSVGVPPLEVNFTISEFDTSLTSVHSKWDFDDGKTSYKPYPIVHNHTYTLPGEYHPVYRMESDQGTFECTAFIVVKAVSPLTVSLEATTPRTGVMPLDVSFKASVENGTPPLQYVWDFGDGTDPVHGTQNIQSHHYVTSGIFPVSVEVTDSLGITVQSNSVNIFVNRTNAITLEVDHDTGFEGLTSTFYAVVAEGVPPPYVYSFDFGDGQTIQNGNSPRAVHTYTDASTYTAVVSVVDGNGVQSSASHKIVVVETLDNDEISSNFSALTSQAGEAYSPELLQTFLDEGKGIAGNALSPLHNAPEARRKLIKKTVRDNTENLLEAVDTRLEYFEDQGTVSSESMAAVKDQVSKLITTIVHNDVALTPTAIRKTASISGRAFNQNIQNVLTEKGLPSEEINTLLGDKEQLKTFLASSPETFNAIYGVSVVPVNAQRGPDRSGVEKVLTTFGISPDLLPELQAAIPETTDLTKNIRDSADELQTDSILDVFLAMLNSNPSIDSFLNSPTAGSGPGFADSPEIQSVLDSEIDSLSGNVQVMFQNMKRFSMGIPQVGVVSDRFPKGMQLLQDGSIAGLYDQFSFKIYPAPADPVSISAQVIKTFGMIPIFSEDGRLSVDYGEGIISLGMGWNINEPGTFSEYQGRQSATLSSLSDSLVCVLGKLASSVGTVGFTGAGGTDSAGYSYSILVQYDDGTTQLMPPMIMAESEILSILEALLPGVSSLDRNTGVLTIDQWDLKPDYLFIPLTEIDYTAIQQNNGFIYGDAAFEFEDYNSDGQTDMKYYSHDPMGVQVLYTAQ